MSNSLDPDQDRRSLGPFISRRNKGVASKQTNLTFVGLAMFYLGYIF